MKKAAFLVMALIIALGALGFAYAKWQSTITIQGTINTGTVKIGIRDTGTTDPPPDLITPPGVVDPNILPNYEPTNGTRDPRVDPLAPWTAGGTPNWVFTDLKNVAATDSDNPDAAVPVCTCSSVGYFASVSENITNAYPFYAPTMTLDIAGCGTIPVKIENVQLTNIQGNASILNTPCVEWGWNFSGVCTGAGHGTLAEMVQALKDSKCQIHQCQVLTIGLTAVFLECLPQSSSVSFDIVVTASQWNEV